MKIVSMEEYYRIISNFANKNRSLRAKVKVTDDNEWSEDYYYGIRAMAHERKKVFYNESKIDAGGIELKCGIKIIISEWWTEESEEHIYMLQKC